jgi:hypothetical protein
VPWRFSQEAYEVRRTEQSLKVARWRWARSVGSPEHRGITEAAEASEWLDGKKVDKARASCGQPPGQRQKANSHAGRMNRRLRFGEKARYKRRKRKSIVRSTLLRIGRHAPKPRTQVQQPLPGGGG